MGVVGGVMIESDDEVERRFSFLFASLLLLFRLLLSRKMTASAGVVSGFISLTPYTRGVPPMGTTPLLLLLLLVCGGGTGGWGLFNNQSL